MGAKYLDFNSKYEALIERYMVPGLAVAVVRGSEIEYSHGFGVKEIGGSEAPDENTVFPIASLSKAFAAAALAILKERGSLDWNVPAGQYLNELKMYDEYASANVTLHDMLTHTTGIARYDDELEHALSQCRTSDELVGRIALLSPNKGFRERHEYNNFMYTAASVIAQRLSGSAWEPFVKQSIWDKLGMSRTSATIDGLMRFDNRAIGHRLQDGQAKKVGYENVDIVLGAGAVNSTLADMAKWLVFIMNRTPELLSKEVFDELFEPRVIVPEPFAMEFSEMPLCAYAYGWRVQPFRGELCIQHTGGISGFSTYITFLPKHRFGIVALMNLEGGSLHRAAATELLDMELGYDFQGWPQRFYENDRTLSAKGGV